MYEILFAFLLIFISSESVSQRSFDAEVLEERTHCLIRNNQLTIDKSCRIRINNRDGDNFSKISIYYRKNDPIQIEEAWIENNSGKIVRKISKKEITTSSAISGFSLYEDSHVDHFTLRYNEYPYTICYRYTQSLKEFFNIINWSPVKFTNIPTLQASLTVQMPQKYRVFIHQNKLDSCKKSISGAEITLKWEATYPEPVEEEVFPPFYWDLYPYVRVVPQNFSYYKDGSFENPKEYGNWEASLLEGGQDLPPSEQAIIKSLVRNCRNDFEKVRVLYHYLQDNTRYINVTIDEGGWKPYPASYVASNKYGDCKALSNYMCSILKVAGIRSLYTNIYAGELWPDNDSDISGNLFNHVFVCVPLERDTVWLECTSNSSPFGYLGTFTQNRKAFIIEKNNSQFVRTPGLNSNDVLSSRVIRIDVNRSNRSSGEFNFRLRGHDYEIMQSYKSSPVNLYQEAWITNMFGFKDFTIQDWKFIASDRDSAFIDLKTRMEFNDVVNSYDKIEILKQIKFPLRVPEAPGKRMLDVRIPYPISFADTIEYNLPSEYKSIVIPSDTVIQTKFGSYGRRVAVKNKRSIVLTKFLNIQASRIKQETYSEFYSFIISVKEEENKVVTVRNN